MTLISQVPSTVPASHSVTYSCTMNNNWSAVNHPVNYPSSAHWSPPIIAAHSKKYSVWTPDKLATQGVKNVAETGSTSQLKREIGAAQESDTAGDFVQGSVTFNSSTQSQTFADIMLTPWFDMMSSISMVAPSPDWFTGFYDVRPIDDNSMVWLESFEIATYPWDAGTETGDNYSISNPAEDPKVPILRLTKDTVPDNGVLLNSDGTEVLPMATWTCTLKANSCADHDNVMSRKSKRNCDWVGKARKPTRRKRRCNRRYMGRRLRDYCPDACGMCSIEIFKM